LSPTITLGTQTYVSGLYGQAISFPGTIGAIPATSNIFYTISPTIPVISGFSMSVWAYIPVLGSASMNVLWALNPPGNAFRCRATYQGGGVYNWAGQYYYSGGNTDITSTVKVLANKWYNLTNTMSSSGVHTFYINGDIVGTVTVPGGGSGISSQNINGVTVGSGERFNQFVGYVQDLRFYNTALSAAQIWGIYKSQGIPPRLTMNQTSRSGTSTTMTNTSRSGTPTTMTSG
jgi:hypothetical protein